MAYSEDAYTAGAAVGDSYSNPDVLTFVESSITHPTHTDGFVNVNDPCFVGDIVGVAKESAAAATDFISMKVAGIFSLPVVASDDAGTSAIAVGDKLFISATGILSKLESGKFFGHALNTATASASATNITVWLGGTVDTLLRGLVDFEETLVASGAASTIGVTLLDANVATVAATLAAGADEGQRKVFRVTDVSNPVTLAVASHEMGVTGTYAFPVVGDAVVLEWNGLNWDEITSSANGPFEDLTAVAPACATSGESRLDATSNAVAATLAAGDAVFQRKLVRVTNISNAVTLAVTSHDMGVTATYTMTVVGQYVLLEWNGLNWTEIAKDADGPSEALTATTPVCALSGLSTLDAASNAVAATLAVGTQTGARKMVRVIDVSNAVTLIVTGHEMGATTVVYTLAVVGDYVILEWTGVDWAHIAGIGPVETATSTFTLSPKGGTDIDSNGGAVTGTLGDGDHIGQIKTITMSVDASSSSVISITKHATSDPEEATFDALDEALTLVWTGTEWMTVGTPTCTFV